MNPNIQKFFELWIDLLNYSHSEKIDPKTFQNKETAYVNLYKTLRVNQGEIHKLIFDSWPR